MNNICCIFNLAPTYREPIYKKIDKQFNCDFYISDNVNTPLKKMPYSNLLGYKKPLHNIYLKNFYWQKGAIPLVFKPYKQYIMTGELYCISTWVFLLLSKIIGKKTYLWTHGWYGRESYVKKILKKMYFGLSTKVLVYGNYAKKLMIENGFKENKLCVIYNSLDYDAAIEQRKKLQNTDIYIKHFNNNNSNIIFVGRLMKSKKIELLLECIAYLKKNNVYYNIILVGSGDDELYLKKDVDKLEIGNYVWFYGACYDESILSNLIYNADLCVSPGNVGLTAIHAMSYGCPVVTHDDFCNQGPEFEAIQEGKTGMFFKENDIKSLSDSINRWFRYVSSVNREKVREDCYKVIDEKYNPYFQIQVIKKTLDFGKI